MEEFVLQNRQYQRATGALERLKLEKEKAEAKLKKLQNTIRYWRQQARRQSSS